MAAGGNSRASRESRERARLYAARQQFHEGRLRRRTRDNLVAGIAGGALILALFASQAIYFTTGPGAPAPSPTVSTTPTPQATPTPTTTGDPTPTPSVTP
ncbi:hypothetical protein JOD63_001335 [Microbacterium terrae]|uniref:Dioxygenase n=1 Tax=Microbacterium terrae TaxID=69369 RepID=A0A0M2H1L2_9MICO|nr:hypothetical protein [Microbacterium terrae]KJL37958.1 hypothetical protein RS81_02954 [Microbacterium terrae]MBP1077367.1 hypothetical protein [Microbacterium terrae]GLJ98977.1 hypothetical protein GCM10017594_21740 [Microbacterium terrae]